MPLHRLVILLGLLSLVMSWFYGMIDYTGEFAHTDLGHYLAMAEAAPGLNPEVRWPFGHRILGPWVAGLFPASDPLSFRILTSTLLVATTLLLFGFLRRFVVDEGVAAFVAALFTLNPYWYGLLAFNYFHLNDVISLLCVVGAFWAMYTRRIVAFGALVLIGVFAREVALLLVPVAPVVAMCRHRQDWRRASLWLVAGLPALAGFVLLRTLIPSPGTNFFFAFSRHADKAFELETWYRLLVNSYTPLSLLPLVFWRQTKEFVRRYPEFVVFGVLTLASAFFGGDQERLVAPAFIVAYSLSAIIIQRELWTVSWMKWLLVGAAAFTSLHHLTARFPLPDRWMTLVITLIALVVVTTAGLIVRRKSSDEVVAEAGQ